ncbi:MAG: hypothetical protein ACLGGX_05205 [Bdellovibrionia bacterium]
MKLKSLCSIIILAGFVFTTQSISDSREVCKGFLPPNDLKIPVSIFNTGGLTEAQFNTVLDRIEKIYGPDIAAMGNRLKVNRLWDDPTVNASANRSGKDFVINMYGGLARHAAVTEEGFALVACHEIGHHIGGAPKVKGWFNNWASNEGASDYFATLKCLRRYFASFESGDVLDKSEVSTFARQSCEAQWVNLYDQEICLLNSLAGQSVANLFADLRKDKAPPKFETPDPKKVSRIDDNHPETQCRLDTYFQGALCISKINEPLSDTDYRMGSCHEETDTVGLRPRCWFVPN